MSPTPTSPSDLEALADALSASANELHRRIMRALRHEQHLNGGLSQGAAQALLENEVAMRQQANNLYVDAAKLALQGLPVARQELLDLAAGARQTIRRINQLKDLVGISADLLSVAAALAAGRPEHLAAPLESLKKRLAAPQQDGSA